MEKDCIFLLADKQMESAFKGFLGRNNFQLSLGIRSFTADIIVDAQNGDPGLYKRGHEFLQLYHRSHQYAVVVLDNAWEGSPGPARIRETIKRNLTRNGWREDNVEVVVIEPELEVWLWQDSPHIAQVLRFDHQPFPSLRQWLEDQRLWNTTDLKPAQPKEAFQLVARKADLPLSGAIYGHITRLVSVHRCEDLAFCLLRDTLQRWFPNDGGQP